MPPGQCGAVAAGSRHHLQCVAYLLYYRLIRDVGPTRTISVTFLVPVFGGLWGAIFFGETLNGGALIGSVIGPGRCGSRRRRVSIAAT